MGRLYVLGFGGVQVPEHLIDYIDYEAYGLDVRNNDDDYYAPGGYVADNRNIFIAHYTGRYDISDEHRVFSIPKLSIREQISAFKEIIDRSSLESERKRPALGHTER